MHIPRRKTISQAQLRAASALRGLSVDEDLRNEIVIRGGLVPLLRLSSSDDVEIQMEVCMYEHTLEKPGGQVFLAWHRTSLHRNGKRVTAGQFNDCSMSISISIRIRISIRISISIRKNVSVSISTTISIITSISIYTRISTGTSTSKNLNMRHPTSDVRLTFGGTN